MLLHSAFLNLRLLLRFEKKQKAEAEAKSRISFFCILLADLLFATLLTTPKVSRCAYFLKVCTYLKVNKYLVFHDLQSILKIEKYLKVSAKKFSTKGKIEFTQNFLRRAAKTWKPEKKFIQNFRGCQKIWKVGGKRWQNLKIFHVVLVNFTPPNRNVPRIQNTYLKALYIIFNRKLRHHTYFKKRKTIYASYFYYISNLMYSFFMTLFVFTYLQLLHIFRKCLKTEKRSKKLIYMFWKFFTY